MASCLSIVAHDGAVASVSFARRHSVRFYRLLVSDYVYATEQTVSSPLCAIASKEKVLVLYVMLLFDVVYAKYLLVLWACVSNPLS